MQVSCYASKLKYFVLAFVLMWFLQVLDVLHDYHSDARFIESEVCAYALLLRHGAKKKIIHMHSHSNRCKYRIKILIPWHKF